MRSYKPRSNKHQSDTEKKNNNLWVLIVPTEKIIWSNKTITVGKWYKSSLRIWSVCLNNGINQTTYTLGKIHQILKVAGMSKESGISLTILYSEDGIFRPSILLDPEGLIFPRQTPGIQSPCQRMIGVYNHLLRKVFRFHYHSQKVIGSLGP